MAGDETNHQALAQAASEEPEAATPRRAARGSKWRVRGLRGRGWLLKVVTLAVPPLVSAMLYLLSRTLRVRMFGGEDLFERLARGERLIVAFWHNRLLLMPTVAPAQPFCIMVSTHRDGEIAVRALRRWNVRTVRGSATRGGARGFLQLVRAYRDGCSIAVAPDGPKGPLHVAKPGVIHLARLTGATIYPVSYAASRARSLRSWDRLLVPLPFARIAFVAGEPVEVPREADPERVESLRKLLETRLNELDRTAEAHLVG